jgi:predicted permease
MTNLKLAFRTLLKTPFVTLVAVASLALGIGSNAAIFSLFDQLLLRPIPGARDQGQLVNLGAPGPNPGSQSCGQAGGCDVVFSYPMFRDLEKSPAGFTAIAAHRNFAANVAYKNQTLNTEGLFVSGSYFPMLGVTPSVGRLLTPSDDQTIGGHYVAVLGHAFWTDKLGGNARVVGDKIVINGQTFTVVGIAGEKFDGITSGQSPAVYVPITMRKVINPWFNAFTERRNYWIYLFGRLKPGVSLNQAQTAINAVYSPIIAEVEAPLQKGMSAATLVKFKAKKVILEDGRRGQSSMHREAKTPLILLMSITGIVLLIACANIANLLLARAAGRTTEMAVRLSLGATRTQVLAQLLTESVLLAVLGGMASLLFAHWTLVGLAQLLPPDASGVIHFELDWAVIWFSAALSLATGLVFGLFPALQSTNPDLVSVLRAGSGKLAGVKAASRFRNSLVTVQIALSMALLASAGVFVKSLDNVSKVDLGIRTENVVTFGLSPELNGYSHARSRQLFQEVSDALAAVPGVTNVSASVIQLLANNNWGNDVAVQGFKKGPDTDANANFNEVGPGFYKALGTTLLSGREFSPSDNLNGPKVAIVNEEFARKFGLGRDAVGKYMGTGRGDSLNIQIVGLVRNAGYSDVKQKPRPVFAIPYMQDSSLGSLTFYARTAADPIQTLRAVPALIRRLDPTLPVENLKTLSQQVKENVFLDRMISTLSASFALLATLLAAIGLYGMLAYSVAQRTREIGVRMALGADLWRVRRLVLRQVAVLTVIGAAVGIAGAVAIGRGASSLLFEVKGTDPVVLAVATVVLAIVALGAGLIPAVRASRVDPMDALRYE